MNVFGSLFIASSSTVRSGAMCRPYDTTARNTESFGRCLVDRGFCLSRFEGYVLSCIAVLGVSNTVATEIEKYGVEYLGVHLGIAAKYAEHVTFSKVKGSS